MPAPCEHFDISSETDDAIKQHMAALKVPLPDDGSDSDDESTVGNEGQDMKDEVTLSGEVGREITVSRPMDPDDNRSQPCQTATQQRMKRYSFRRTDKIRGTIEFGPEDISRIFGHTHYGEDFEDSDEDSLDEALLQAYWGRK